jgi:DNA-binding FadR family transcriptional regulator
LKKQNTIKKLKQEHKEILEILKNAYSGNGIASSEWKEAVIRAKKLFESHLDHEDHTIYSDEFFNNVFSSSYNQTAQKFQDEMKDITVFVENFFKKYRETTEHQDFNADYARLVNALQKRIEAEEKILFAEFEKL